MPFSFINSALLWGAGLISVPIIIHLLNRRRFVVVDWAAMEWLLQAMKQNKRRVTIEQLLLLALRCLIILLLVLALSKMFFQGGGGGVLPGTTTDWVVVLDDSFTSGQAGSEGVCFERAKEQSKELLKKVLGASPKDSFTITVTGDDGRRSFSLEQMEREAADRIARRVDHFDASDLVYDPVDLLDHGLTVLSGKQNANKALVLVTDCRLANWRLNEPQTEALKRVLTEAKGQGVRIYILDVGPTDGQDFANTAVVGLEPSKKSIQIGAVEEFTTIIRNFGPDPVSNLPLKFTVVSSETGAQTLPTRNIANIPAGEQVEEKLSYQFRTPGAYAVTAEVGSDALPADNARHLAFRATDGIPVLLVDGDMKPKRSESDTFALGVALRPTRRKTFGIEPTTVSAETFTPPLLNKARVIFLANVAQVSPEIQKNLLEFVQEGGGVVIFPGDKIDPITFNRVFYDEGRGIAPCALERAVGNAEDALRVDGGGKFVRLSSEYMSHPVMAVFPPELSVIIGGARFYRYFEMRIPGDPKAARFNEVAYYNDADRTPAIVEREIGKGRVIMVATTADSDWNNWPTAITYPVLMKSLVEYLYIPGLGGRNLTTGMRYVRKVDLSQHEMIVAIEPPKQGAPMKRAAEVDETGEASVTLKQTDTAGIYAVKLNRRAVDAQPGEADVEVEYFSANVNTQHSDLRRPTDPQRFEAQLTSMGITYGRNAGDIWKDAPEERVNLWHYLLFLLGICLVLESFLGWKFGHHTK